MKKITKSINKVFIFTFIFITFALINLISMPAQHVSHQKTKAETVNSYKPVAKNQLNTAAKNLYDYLADKFIKISNGELSSSKFEIDKDTLNSMGIKTSWTNTELNKSTISINDVEPLFFEQLELTNLLLAIMHDMPYELYWFDKTIGTSESLLVSTSQTKITITSYILIFSVCKDFRPASYNSQSPTVDTTTATFAKTCLDNAKQIVEQYKNLNDYEKLVAYKNKILDLVSYNTEAVSGSYINGYGNPWQLLYVFDNNSSTNVVCEGYSKAFQLLCNLSSFQSGYIKCYTISGELGTESHMWNLVTMDDQNTYLIDLTNSDSNTVGSSGGLFLAGTINGSLLNGYTFNLSKTITYVYKTNNINLWGNSSKSILNINTSSYEYVDYIIEVNNIENLTYKNQEFTCGLTGSTNVDFTFNFVDATLDEANYNWSYVWYSSLNGTIDQKLSGNVSDAGTYYIEITATNKTLPTLTYSLNKKITILPKELTVSSVVAQDKVYNKTKNVSLTTINLSGVLNEDDVYVSTNSTVAKVNGTNVGLYSFVNLSEIKLSGADKNNYIITDELNNISSNEIEIKKAILTCSQTFSEITSSGKKLNEIVMQVSARGVSNETVSGTYVWVNEDGTPIDTNTKILKDTTYYYKFSPNNDNYESKIVEICLWETEKDDANTSFFSEENFPKILEYALYLIAGIIVISCIIITVKRRKKVR